MTGAQEKLPAPWRVCPGACTALVTERWRPRSPAGHMLTRQVLSASGGKDSLPPSHNYSPTPRRGPGRR